MYRERAYVPYSGSRIATVFLLSDGSLIPGVRVESASFSLVIPAVLNGYTTAIAFQRTDVQAVVQSEPFGPEDQLFLETILERSLKKVSDEAYIRVRGGLPRISGEMDPFVKVRELEGEDQAIRLVREVAQNAFVPESTFPVGCILDTGSGRFIPGVNVENRDWTRVLCAERNALGTAISYGIRDIKSLYLTCPEDWSCTPCGACRQLLAEIVPDAKLFMDRGKEPPVQASPRDLLPGFFTGHFLSRNKGT